MTIQHGSSIRLDNAPAAAPASDPPTEFLIWAWGDIETSKGLFLFDALAAEAVMARFREHGNELFIDYQHLGVDPDARAGDGRAAGWFMPEVREDGLWAVNVTWTPAAAEGLRNREWRYFSPAFVTDAENRVVELTNIALTNLPATRNMQPLVAHRLTEETMDPNENKAPETTAAEAVAPPVDPAAQAKAARAAEALRAAKAYLAKCEEDAKALGVALEDEAQDGQPQTSGDGLMGEGGETAADVDPAAAPQTDDVPGDYKADPYGEDQESEDSSDTAVMPAAPPAEQTAKLAALGVFAMKALGAKNSSEARGKLRALSATSKSPSSHTLDARVQKLESELARYRTAEKRRAVEGVVEGGVRLGKITPAMRSWALSLGMKDLTELKAYIDAAPALVSVVAREGATAKVEGPRPPVAAKNDVTLSENEKRIIAISGVSADEYLASKRAAKSR